MTEERDSMMAVLHAREASHRASRRVAAAFKGATESGIHTEEQGAAAGELTRASGEEADAVIAWAALGYPKP